MDIRFDKTTFIDVYDNSPLVPYNELFPTTTLRPSNTIGANYRRISKIVSGTLVLNEIIATDNLIFGLPCANRFEVQIYDETDISGMGIHVYQMDEEGTITSLFVGVIDSAKTDKSNTYRKVIAYDNFYNLSKLDIADWWNTFWTNKTTATLKQLRDSLFSQYGLLYENKVLPNDSIAVEKNVEIKSMPFTQMVTLICELQGCIPNIDRSGVVRFLTISSLSSTSVNITNEFEGETEYDEYQVQEITGVQFYNSTESLKYTVGNYENSYQIVDNIFIYSLDTETLNTLGTNLLNAIKYISYTPSKVKMIVRNWGIHVGDFVTCSQFTSLVTEQTYSGIQFVEQEILSTGKEKIDEVTKPFDTSTQLINEKLASISYDLDSFQVDYADFKLDVASSFQQTADAINLKVSKDGVINAINLSTEGVAIKASKINLNGAVTANNYFKINLDGSMEATAGEIANWHILQNYMYSDVDYGLTGKYRAFIQSTSNHYEGTWVFSTQKYNEDLQSYVARFYVDYDGQGYFYGSVQIGNQLIVSNSVTAPQFNGALNGNATSATTAGTVNSITNHNLKELAKTITPAGNFRMIEDDTSSWGNAAAVQWVLDKFAEHIQNYHSS